jgi:hypothetical protein
MLPHLYVQFYVLCISYNTFNLKIENDQRKGYELVNLKKLNPSNSSQSLLALILMLSIFNYLFAWRGVWQISVYLLEHIDTGFKMSPHLSNKYG